jgi:autotransporter adhesin
VTAPSYQVGNTSYNNVGGAIAALNNGLSDLQGQVDYDYKHANGGIAAAMAAAALRYDDQAGKISVAGGISEYNDETGISGGIGWTSDDMKWRAAGMLTFSPTVPRAPDFGGAASLSYSLN